MQWLIVTVKFARENSKTTRRAVIDNLMRSSPNFDYKGATMVQRPDDKTKTFSTFSKFIVAAEEKGKIKTEIIEGFMEIFLPEEDPNVESELSPNLKDVIDKEDWKKIFEIIIKNFIEDKNVDENEIKYGYLHTSLRTAKKEGLLLYSNRKLANALKKLIDIGFLIPQTDKTFSLTPDYKEAKETYLEKAMNNKDSKL